MSDERIRVNVNTEGGQRLVKQARGIYKRLVGMITNLMTIGDSIMSDIFDTEDSILCSIKRMDLVLSDFEISMLMDIFDSFRAIRTIENWKVRSLIEELIEFLKKNVTSSIYLSRMYCVRQLFTSYIDLFGAIDSYAEALQNYCRILCDDYDEAIFKHLEPPYYAADVYKHLLDIGEMYPIFKSEKESE